MSQNLFTYRIQTSGKQSLTNIDVYLEDALTKSGVKDGCCWGLGKASISGTMMDRVTVNFT